MSVQHKVGRGAAAQKCSGVLDPLSCLLGEDKCVDIQSRIIVAMHDFTEANLTTKRFGQHERIERQKQFVFFGNLVARLESIGDEYSRSATALGGHPFNGLEAGFHFLCLPTHVASE